MRPTKLKLDTHGQWLDLLCTPNASSQNILVPLFFIFSVSPSSKDKKLASTNLFQHTSDGVCELCSLSAIFFWVNF